ncbi:MAG: chitobiase/beta-hexosaminidase C-terminal domain-containing protein [Ignavibacteriaceae bacterium]|nr:chitobiase/beta-hexosaminidase C-terminal domain-containing protein [Ignavibacteriaceae bacterium]
MKNQILFLALFTLFYISSAVSQDNTPVLEGTHNNAYTTVEPPSIFKYRTLLGKTATSDFQINYENPAPPYQAQIAIEYAVKIWEFLINSNQIIKINIKWEDLGYSSTSGYTLAKCGTDTFYNSPSLPESNVQYPIALAEHLLGQNLNGSSFDIVMYINSNDSIDWYFGTEGIPQEDKNDMVSVILHEIAHGLGYIGFFGVSGSYGYRGISGIPVDTNSHPSIYDTYGALANYYPALDFLINYPNHSTELKGKLTGNSVYFSGDNSWIQYGRNILPKLYAPASWKSGSSIFHLDDETFPQGNSNSLMTPSIDQAEVIHSPGEVGLAILQDIGWSINRLATFLHPEPGVALQKGAIDTIKWTDNEGGSFSLVLLDSIDNFIMTVCTLGTADVGLNEYIWTVPTNVTNGKYRIKVQFGGAFGITNLFTITNQQQVATPVFTPPPGTYPDTVSITASCPTPGATIRYTTNGTEPNSNSPVFPPSLLISTFTTIKAKAFKDGMLPSLTTVAIYSIGIEVAAPEISPVSGSYAGEVYLEITCPDPAAVIRYNWSYDPNNPPADPDENSTRWDWNPGTGNGIHFLYPTFHNLIVKAKTYRPGYVPSPVISTTYQIVHGVNIKQFDASGTPFGQAAFWNTSQWNYVDPDSAIVLETNKNHFLSTQDFKPGTNQKFNFWDDNLLITNDSYRNWDTITIKSSTTEVSSHFNITVDGVVIKNNLESTGINGGSIEFMDPWLVDFNEPPYGYRSRGMDAPFFPKTSPFNPNYSSSYKGVFLNQGSPNWTPPYYKVGMLEEQPITVNGKERKFYPYKWQNDGGVTFQVEYARQTGVVFTSSNATATAVLKGQLMSNDQNGISGGSQRKLIRTDNGIYHCVYESMGEVWYTHSLTTNFQGAWSQDYSINEGQGQAKNPAIDYEGNEVKIVFEYYDPQQGGDAKIFAAIIGLYGNGTYTYEGSEEVASYSNSYFSNAKPVISYGQWEIFIAYRNGPAGGLKQKTKFSDGTYWGCWSAEDDIPGTNADCINPSITGFRQIANLAYVFIVYENFGTIYFKQARRWFDNYGNSYWDYQSYATFADILSKGSGFNLNRYPVISLANQNSANQYLMVSWQGIYNGTPTNPFPKTDGSVPLYREAAVVKTRNGSTWGTSSSFSKNVDYTSNGSLNNLYGSILTWSESDGQYSKYVRRRTSTGYDPITSLSNNGIQTLVSNGSDFGNLKAMVFNNSTSAPYFLNRCIDDFTYIPDGLGKITEDGLIDISYGRSGIVEKNGIEFVFNIGDVLLDGETIKFIERADTIPILNLEELNALVRTDTLNLDAESELIFSDYYYVVDSEIADSLLSDDLNVNFKCQLVKLSSGEVVGEFEEVNYNKNNLEAYGYQGYLIDCTGIAAGKYYLRLATSVNEEVNLSLSDIQMDEVLLEKSKLNVRNFKGSELPLEYSLEQNYPNPFNPNTTIKFQIPKEGMVTLKVYDILGAEVAILVDEEKVAGKYEVNFDANNLASGIYIYCLNVNDFANVKKMVLLK